MVSRSQRIISLALLLSLSACVHPSKPLPKTAAEARKPTIEFRRIRVIPALEGPSFATDIVNNRRDGLTRGATQGAGLALALLGETSRAANVEGAGGVLLVEVALAPVFAAGGALYGAVKSDSAGQVKLLLQPLVDHVGNCDLQEALSRHVRQEIPEGYILIPGEVAGPATQDSSGGEQAGAEPETVLEVGLLTIRLETQPFEADNSEVVLKVQGFARVVRSSDGAEIFYRRYNTDSLPRSLRQWAAADAELFKQTLETDLRYLATQIGRDIF